MNWWWIDFDIYKETLCVCMLMIWWHKNQIHIWYVTLIIKTDRVISIFDWFVKLNETHVLIWRSVVIFVWIKSETNHHNKSKKQTFIQFNSNTRLSNKYHYMNTLPYSLVSLFQWVPPTTFYDYYIYFYFDGLI